MFATPIDDKAPSSKPNVSTLLVKKGDASGSDNVKISPVQGGVQAHPLHKRDAPKVGDQASNLTPFNTAKLQVVRPGNLNNPQSSNIQQLPVSSLSSARPQQTRQSVNSPGGQTPQSTSLNPSAPRSSAQVNGQQQPILSQSARVRRDAPRIADQKNVAVNLNGTATKLEQKTQSNTPSYKRPTRDAPNPIDQSKIVPSAYQPSQVKNDYKNSDLKSTKVGTSSNLAAVAKSDSQVPHNHKRESPVTNVREPLQSSSSSSNNQSPSFVHPVPVDQILKKPIDAAT